MISTRIRGVSPDKTDCLANRSWGPIFLSATSLLQNDTKDPKSDTKVAAVSALTDCFFICLPQEERGYHIVTDDANKSQPLLTVPYEIDSLLTLPEYAVEVCLLC
ncbi:hypothetical protein ES703_11646 [subsurface metagenome]